MMSHLWQTSALSVTKSTPQTDACDYSSSIQNRFCVINEIIESIGCKFNDKIYCVMTEMINTFLHNVVIVAWCTPWVYLI